MINILVTDITLKGGLQKAIYNLISKLDKYEFHIISIFKSSKNENFINLANCKITYIHSSSFNKFKYYFFTQYKLKEILKNQSLIISTGFFHNFLLFNSPKQLYRITWLHYRVNSYKKLSLNKFLEIYTLKFFNLIIFVNKIDFESSKLDREKKIYIHNLILEKKIKNIKSITPPLNIILVGGLYTWKNHLEFIEAYYEKLRNTNIKVDIFGDGPLKNLLQEKINSLKLEDNIQLKGYTNNVQDKYNEYDLLVHPSYKEGYGLVISESLLKGTPVICFSNDGISEHIFKDKIHGEIIRDNDMNILAEKIKYFNDNPYILENYRQNLSLINFDMLNNLSLKKWNKVMERFL